MSKFTSGPWRHHKTRGHRVWGQPQYEISGGEHAFWIAGVGAPHEVKQVAQANARRIVQCVNNFDDLLAALEMVGNVFNLNLYGTDTGGGKCYSKIQALIAKATGK